MTHSFPPRRSSDIAEILSKKPEAINDYHDPVWPSKEEAGSFFWSEPLYGYYLDTDRWVLYKHAEMLSDAGVGVIMFDCTNGDLTLPNSYNSMCVDFSEARKHGIRTPTITFNIAFVLSE